MTQHSLFSRNAKAMQSYLDPRQPGYLILFVTNRCNFRCKFCFYADEIDKGKKTDELSLEELTKVAKKIGPLLQLSMTGGEPFLRKDFTDVTAAFIDNAYARYISIPTNASMPDVMVRYLEEILPAYPNNYFRVAFSIEGIGEVHDQARSMPGSYDKVVESYKAVGPLRKKFPNLVLDANSVFTTKTETTLLDTLGYLAREFDFDNLSVTYARGEVRDPELKKTSKENYIKVNDYLEELKRTKESRFLYPLVRGVRDVSRDFLIKTVFDDVYVTSCVAGKKLLVLSETGELYPCEILNKSMGNVRDVDFDIHALLRRPENRELSRWIIDSKCKCSFECALAANVIWNLSSYPKLVKSTLKNIGKK